VVQQSWDCAPLGKANVPAVLWKLNCLLDISSADSEFVGFGKCCTFGTELKLLESLFAISYVTYC